MPADRDQPQYTRYRARRRLLAGDGDELGAAAGDAPRAKAAPVRAGGGRRLHLTNDT